MPAHGDETTLVPAAMDIVSVVIPCHNYGRFLGEAIGSARGQEGAEVEVVVVDDGSTDHTKAVAGSFEGVRYLRQEQAGVSAARNHGLAQAEGGLVLFLDADDRLLPGALAALAAALDADPAAVFAFGLHQPIAEDGTPLGPPRRIAPPVDVYAAMLRGDQHPVHTPGVVLYRRQAVEAAGGFESAVNGCEDLDLNLRIARERGSVFVDRPVLEYRQHGSSTVRRSAPMLRSSVRTQRRQRAWVRAHPRYRDDYRAGMRLARSYFGRHLAKDVRREAAAGRWRAALRGFGTLLRWAPRDALNVLRP